MAQQNEDLRVLAVIHRVIGWLAAIFGAIPPVFVIAVSWVKQDFERTNRTAPEIFSRNQAIFLLALGAALWIYALLLHRSARLIEQRRSRRFIIATNVASLLFMPFGTVVGLLTFATMAKPEVKAMFDKQT